jgi:hypothetical protein
MAEFHARCPECNKEFPIKDLKLPPVPIASSTRSFAQKITSIKIKDEGYQLGIATFGLGVITGKTIYYHLRLLNQKEEFENLSSAAEKIGNYFHQQLKVQFGDLADAPDDVFPLGFHLVGYDDDTGKVRKIYIGKEIKTEDFAKIGCVFGGEGTLIKKLWEIQQQSSEYSTIYESLSLQDAVDLAEFYIQTTAGFQRFSNMIPNVGGDVDIALITRYSGFKWIKCKELSKKLEADKEQSNETTCK